MLETLSYRNERAVIFEVFNSKFHTAVNILDSYSRNMHNKDFVVLFWTKLNNAGLAMFVASIKVDYRRNNQKYTDILQEISTQIPTDNTSPFTTDAVL